MTEVSEREAIIAWLRKLNEGDRSHNHWTYIARRIELGDYLNPENTND